MENNLIEIREFNGEGYRPLVDFQTWRVAILNYLDEIHPARQERVERHMQTDEVFVLLKGRAVLFLGAGEAGPASLEACVLEAGKIYNVKRAVWHTVVMTRDGSVLIVENQDTGRANSQYSPLSPGQKEKILSTARQEHPGLWE